MAQQVRSLEDKPFLILLYMASACIICNIAHLICNKAHNLVLPAIPWSLE